MTMEMNASICLSPKGNTPKEHILELITTHKSSLCLKQTRDCYNETTYTTFLGKHDVSSSAGISRQRTGQV